MPDDVGLLAVDPVAAFGIQRQVEVEDDTGHDETHLSIGKAIEGTQVSIGSNGTEGGVDGSKENSLLSDAVTGSGAEGLHGVENVGLVLLVAEPALGSELEGVGPVLVPVVDGPLEDGDDSLFTVQSVFWFS